MRSRSLRGTPCPPHLGLTHEGSHLVKVHLVDFLEGVVMALGTGNFRAEEHREGVGEIAERHAEIRQQITGSGIVPNLTFGREHLTHHDVIWLVGRNAILHPVDVTVRTQLVGVHAHPGPNTENVAVPVEHVHREGIRVEELIDQLSALVPTATLHEGRPLVVSRDAASDIEIDSAHELLISDGLIRRRHRNLTLQLLDVLLLLRGINALLADQFGTLLADVNVGRLQFVQHQAVDLGSNGPRIVRHVVLHINLIRFTELLERELELGPVGPLQANNQVAAHSFVAKIFGFNFPPLDIGPSSNLGLGGRGKQCEQQCRRHSPKC